MRLVVFKQGEASVCFALDNFLYIAVQGKVLEIGLRGEDQFQFVYEDFAHAEQALIDFVDGIH